MSTNIDQFYCLLRMIQTIYLRPVKLSNSFMAHLPISVCKTHWCPFCTLTIIKSKCGGQNAQIWLLARYIGELLAHVWTANDEPLQMSYELFGPLRGGDRAEEPCQHLAVMKGQRRKHTGIHTHTHFPFPCHYYVYLQFECRLAAVWEVMDEFPLLLSW